MLALCELLDCAYSILHVARPPHPLPLQRVDASGEIPLLLSQLHEFGRSVPCVRFGVAAGD